MAKDDVSGIFERLRNKLSAAFEELPIIIGNEGVNYTLEAFEKQGFEGVPWAQRKSKKDSGRALLTKSGRLKRSFRIISSTPNSVTWGTDVPYAQVHNDGMLINRPARSETFTRPRYLKGAKKGSFKKFTKEDRSGAPVKGSSYKSYSYYMTRRQFMGVTHELINRLKEVAKTHILEAIKQQP